MSLFPLAEISLQCIFPKLKPEKPPLSSLPSSPISWMCHEVLQSLSSEGLWVSPSLYHSGPCLWPPASVLMQISPNALFTFHCSPWIWHDVTTFIFLKYHFHFLKSVFKVDIYYINPFSPLIYYDVFFPWWSLYVGTQRPTISVSVILSISWCDCTINCLIFPLLTEFNSLQNVYYFKQSLHIHLSAHLWVFQ